MGSSRRFVLLLALAGVCRPPGITAAPTAPAPAASTAHEVVTDGVVAIGGPSLHIHCIGEGAPIVILDSGLGNDGSVWNDVQPAMSQFTRVCAYDRAGMGYSIGAAPKPHTNRQMAHELHTLLERANLVPPYVLVGHSLGGVNVRLFASEHANEVAGMVLVDAVTDEQRPRYWALLSERELTAFRADILKLHEGTDFETFVAGIADMHASNPSIGDTPLVVLTRGKEDAPPEAPSERTALMLRTWQTMQADLTHLSTNAVQIVATKSRHFIQWDAPKLVVASVHEVVEASRTHARVTGEKLAPLANEEPP